MTMPLRLLLIEDSEDDAWLILRELKRYGYQVEHQRVQTAETVRDALVQKKWDIIISDHAMPQFTGLEALDILKATKLDIPFIIVSGAIGEELAVKIMKAGASDYVMKDKLGRLPLATERELRETEDRLAHRRAEVEIYTLSSALAQSTSLVMITNTNAIIEYVNETFCRVTGYSTEEVIGKRTNMLQSGETSNEIYNNLWQAIRNGQEWRGELLNRKKNGETYWVHMTISAIRNPEGEIVRYLAVQEDISERKRLEAEIQHHTEQLEQMVKERTAQLQIAKDQMEAILENSEDCIALTSPSGDILTANPAFYNLFEGRVKQSIEEILLFLSSEQERNIVAETILAVLNHKQNARIQVSIKYENNRVIDLDLAFAPVEVDGEVEAIVFSARDITPLKDLERFKARFVANAVHDLGNPIATLKVRLHLLRARPENIERHANVFESQLNRLNHLVTELRTLSELDRGIIIIEKTPVNLNQLVFDVVESHQPIAAEKNLTLIFEQDANLLGVPLDYNRFERVVVNLISNAINYTPENGQVFVMTRIENDEAIFQVADNGIGIEAEALTYIFERFYRTDRAQKTDSNGTGLGLSIVKEMVEAHGGTISVNSELDKGTTFIVKIPLTSE